VTITHPRTTHRAFLVAPGEPPVLPDDIGELLRRRWAFCAVTGLDDDHVHTDPLVALPLPERTEGRWRGNASFLWCPLAYLPDALSAPPGGRRGAIPTVASRVWATTVILTLGASGLYSVDEGFFDLERTWGFDLADPDTAARAAAWCDGAADVLFDAIERDIHDRLLRNTNPARTGAMMSLLHDQQSLIADALARSFAAVPDQRVALTGYLAVALDLLGDIPAAFTPHRTGDIVLAMLNEVGGTVHRDSETIPEEMVDETIADFTEMLDTIANGKRPGDR